MSEQRTPSVGVFVPILKKTEHILVAQYLNNVEREVKQSAKYEHKSFKLRLIRWCF